MRILRANDYRRMRWKNGDGETTEIIVSPDGASLEAFDWRVSMAHVASDGPFSLFPDIDRTLAVLSGRGLRLKIVGSEPVMLDKVTKPYSFAADVTAFADLIDGPIDDLNVMTRRGRYRHELSRLHADGRVSLARTGDITLVISPEASAEVHGAASEDLMMPGDTLLMDHPDVPAIAFTTSAATSIYVVTLRRV